jgi:hypothetical protein
MTLIDPSSVAQVVVAAVAGWFAGRGRLRAELETERSARRELETELKSAMRELAFTNALVVELVRKHGISPSHSSRNEETPQ